MVRGPGYNERGLPDGGELGATHAGAGDGVQEAFVAASATRTRTCCGGQNGAEERGEVRVIGQAIFKKNHVKIFQFFRIKKFVWKNLGASLAF